MSFPWLTENKSETDEVCYSLEEAHKKNYEIIELIEKVGWLVIFRRDDVVINFSILQYNHQVFFPERGPIMTSLVFSGDGTSGLRELRHTNWGEEGYIFYVNGNLIIKAFEKLKDYFDF